MVLLMIASQYLKLLGDQEFTFIYLKKIQFVSSYDHFHSPVLG
uniref:Uncharacterized protein n=1 Tax=Anguilla anguilla TaxID=7936 RepID=A0A0E9PCS8_ANGAN